MLKQITASILLTTVLCWPTTSIATKSKNKTKIPPVFVEAITVKSSPHPDQLSSAGTLISVPGITIKPEISGRITKIYFQSGSNVQKGAVLIEINSDLAKAKLESAEASLKLSRLNFDRSLLLYKTKDISRSDLDTAETNYNLAKAKVDSAKAFLQQTTIKAPFAGKLGLSQVSEGDFVNIGQNIVNLQTIDPLKVDFSIPETYQNKIAIGQNVYLKTDAYPKKIFTGKVEAFESLIDPKNRTLNVRANVPNQDGELIPGGFVEVTLQFARENVTMIPQASIVYSSEGNYVFKIVNRKAIKNLVKLGKKDSSNVIVESGLKPGDRIVTTGQMKLHPGSTVIIVDDKKTGSTNKLQSTKQLVR